MSSVEFKKRLCRPVEFKGQGPPSSLCQGLTHFVEFLCQLYILLSSVSYLVGLITCEDL